MNNGQNCEGKKMIAGSFVRPHVLVKFAFTSKHPNGRPNGKTFIRTFKADFQPSRVSEKQTVSELCAMISAQRPDGKVLEVVRRG